MLHSRRTRLAKLAQREAEGESLWKPAFDKPARVKLVHAFRDAVDEQYGSEAFYVAARAAVLRDEGLFFLCDEYMNEMEDLLTYVLRADDGLVPTVVEAMSRALHHDRLRQQTNNYRGCEGFDAIVGVILREQRISYELIDSEMVPIESLAMHSNVIAPPLRLLAGAKILQPVETAYRDALDELSKGKAGNAITDAGTALQELLVALSCEGNALGPLIKSAKVKGLFAGHDSPMVDAIEKVLHWVSADRSEKGDAHSSAEPALDDAWLTVNVVGALLLRLSKGKRNA